jgi:hypothetical protein
MRGVIRGFDPRRSRIFNLAAPPRPAPPRPAPPRAGWTPRRRNSINIFERWESQSGSRDLPQQRP